MLFLPLWQQNLPRYVNCAAVVYLLLWLALNFTQIFINHLTHSQETRVCNFIHSSDSHTLRERSFWWLKQLHVLMESKFFQIQYCSVYKEYSKYSCSLSRSFPPLHVVLALVRNYCFYCVRELPSTLMIQLSKAMEQSWDLNIVRSSHFSTP